MENRTALHDGAGGLPAVGLTRLGLIGDGAFKALLGAGYVIAAAPLGRVLGVSLWVMIVTGVLLLACGIAEMRYADRRPARTCIRLMGVFDSGWVLATVAALLMTQQGDGAGGEVWMAYQAVAAIAMAVLVTTGRPSTARALISG